jgi:glycosyltransferase involved in cell wall biosynthesis
MRVTVITVCYNAEATIEDTIRSVLAQSYRDLEYIVVDGASTDGTMRIIDRYRDRITRIISEPDTGIYDAMNKGVALASGEVIGMLNADDLYLDERVVKHIVDMFEKSGSDAVFADLVYVRPGNLERVVRTYSSRAFTSTKFAYGWMPAHPTFFLKKSCYERYGSYRTDYRIAADFELLARMLHVHKVRYSYIPEVLVKMRMGGESTRSLKSNLILNQEILRACRENGIRTNLLKIYSKYPKKILELFKR